MRESIHGKHMTPKLARAVSVPVNQRLGGRLAMRLVATVGYFGSCRRCSVARGEQVPPVPIG